MTPEQNFQFRNLLSNVLNARATGESDSRQLAHEDHLRNYMDGLLEEKEAENATLKATLEDIFNAWREVGAHDGFIVVSDTLPFYHAVKRHIPELKEETGR
jgi:hypothetical protein